MLPPVLNTREKVELLQTYRDEYDLAVLVETGLYCGNGSGMHVQRVERYYAIDAQPENVELARANGHRALLGDSADVLPGLLELIDEPALFWLDAHAVTSDPDEFPPCPILAELDAITAHRDRLELEHVILIDDLRQYSGDFRGAPTLVELRHLVSDRGWKIIEADDIMRLLP